MPQLQSLVLTDREETPVDHTFTPLDIQNGMGTVVETGGVPVGNNRVQVALNKTSTGRYRAVMKMQFPVVQNQTTNGITTPVVVRTSYVDLSVTFDPTSTTQERENVIGMLQSSLDEGKALIHDTFVNLQGVY